MRNREDVVYLNEEGVLGLVLEVGPYFSKVWFFRDGLEFEIMVENEDFVTMRDGEWK